MPTSSRRARRSVAAVTGLVLFLGACTSESPETQDVSVDEQPAIDLEPQAEAEDESGDISIEPLPEEAVAAAEPEAENAEQPAEQEVVAQEVPEAPAPTAATSTTTTTTAPTTTSTTAAPPPPPVNNFPDIGVTNIGTGSTVSLRSLGGGSEPVVLWFWAPH